MNLINEYLCIGDHTTVTIQRDKGNTPVKISCPECGNDALSKFCQVDQDQTPTYEWYKPSREFRRRNHPDKGFKKFLKEGGLLFRKVREKQD